jgi:hypothetical protein
MYGDDTWLKLFPGTFDRAEGTTSFFVSVSTALSGGREQRLTEAGFHRGGQQCHAAHPGRAQEGRLEHHGPALPRTGSHWPQGRTEEVRGGPA